MEKFLPLKNIPKNDIIKFKKIGGFIYEKKIFITTFNVMCRRLCRGDGL